MLCLFHGRVPQGSGLQNGYGGKIKDGGKPQCFEYSIPRSSGSPMLIPGNQLVRSKRFVFPCGFVSMEQDK